MALYEYQCESCGKRMEVIQSFSDPPPDACEFCGGPVKKLLSAPAVQFKGSGWYVSDYGRGGKVDTAGAAEKSAEKKGAASTSDSKASEPKSDPKGESKSTESKSSESKSTESKSSESSSSPASTSSAPAKSESSSGTP